jgi:hypothetical protein
MRPVAWFALCLSLALFAVMPHASGAGGDAGVLLQESSTPATDSAAPSGANAPQPSGSKIWVGRYAEFEEFLSMADLGKTSRPKVGITGGTQYVEFPPGGLAARGVIRDLQPGRYSGFFESYKSEIAAYKMDRLLELDMVPPTVERRHNGKSVSLQLFVQDVIMLKEMKEKKLQAANPLKWNFQLRRAYAFNNLVGNIDENEGNLMFDALWNFIKVDCSRCFTDKLVQPFEVGKLLNQIDRPFFERIKTLDKETVRSQIGDYLEGGALNALFARRDEMVKDFEKLAEKKGADQVFTPPSPYGR